MTSSRSTRSTAPPPARKGSPSTNAARGPIKTPAPYGASGPRQQIGVMLRDGHHDGRIGFQAQAVRKMIDRFGGVPADNRDVVAVTSAREGERRGACAFVIGGRDLRLVAGSAVHARVP